MMGFYDGAADIEAHAHPIGFCAEKRLKDVLNYRFGNTRSVIGHLDSEHCWKNTSIQVSCNFDRRSRPAGRKWIGFPHAIQSIFEQIDQYLQD